MQKNCWYQSTTILHTYEVMSVCFYLPLLFLTWYYSDFIDEFDLFKMTQN